MQEIVPNVYIETGYAGVTLGAINWPHGLVLIDAPFRPEDTRSWRYALLNLGGGVDRVLVQLGAHPDRTLGAKGMECTVIGHEKMLQVFRNRPVNYRPPSVDTGAEWELHNNLGSVRWAPPEITFSDTMEIHWNQSPLLLEHHPGPEQGAIWVHLPDQHVLFVGDAVVAHQPPILSQADLPAWIESLETLLHPEFQNYLIVGGRNGLVTLGQVRELLEFLVLVQSRLEELGSTQANPEDVSQLAPELIQHFTIPNERYDQYLSRLKYGLQQYFIRHYRPSALQPEEE